MTSDVQGIVGLLAQAWNGHDARLFASLFTEDADYVAAGGDRWSGRGRIEREIAARFAGGRGGDTATFTGTTVRLVSADVAVVHCTWSFAPGGAAESGGGPARRGILSLVAVATGGEWRVAALHNTDIVAE